MATDNKNIVLLVDADYLDHMAFELTVNFERMLERRVQKLDISRWVDYVALDSGLRPGDNAEVQVVMLYSRDKSILRNCSPANLDTELNGTAIKTNIAEYCFASCPVEKDMVSIGELYEQSLLALLHDEKNTQFMLVGDIANYGQQVRQALGEATARQQVMLFAPQAVSGFRCAQEILTYSLMAAMNIRSDELENV